MEQSNGQLIFSDESESWSNQGGICYVRSWVGIDLEDYLNLLAYSERARSVYELPNKELRWNNVGILIEHPQVLEKMFSETKIFLTLTFLKEFYERRFNVRDKIKEMVEKIQIDKSYLGGLPSKVEVAVNYLFFLNIYEKYHLSNALERIVQDGITYDLLVDTPQFLQRDYEKLAESVLKELGKQDSVGTRIVNSKDHLGVQMAGIVSSCFRQMISTGLSDTRSKKFFENYVKPRLHGEGNLGFAGINKVMLEPRLDVEVMEKLRSLIGV